MPELNLPCVVCYLDQNNIPHMTPGAEVSGVGALKILDQTKLPGEVEYLTLTDASAVSDAIKRLCVRGAPAIGCAAAIGLAVCAERMVNTGSFYHKLKETAEFLKCARPTAVNLMWAVDRCFNVITPEMPPAIAAQQILTEALAVVQEDRALCDKIGTAGAELLSDGSTVLTHCNAGALATCGIGTALAPVYKAFEQGKKISVYSDETRPLLQGARLTAWELVHTGIDVCTICDSMSAIVMRQKKVDIVIVGADRVAANGDTANKIGTSLLAMAAKYCNVPFYVAIPYSTIDYTLADGSGIPIEERSANEIFHTQGAKVFNPAFDVTPHELITGFITERGILSAGEL